jgi:hypothetical protein
MAGQAVASDDNMPRASVVCAAEIFCSGNLATHSTYRCYFGNRTGEGWGTHESTWLQNLAENGSEFFSVAKGITSK